MASSDSGPQLAILKRGKRQVATQIKNECGRIAGGGQQQLDEILTFLLDPVKSIDFEATDWCRYLISGGVNFTEYSENVRQFDSAKVCGLVWTANFIAYRCRTCGISPCMSLCPDCFYGADHTGHDFNMFRSHAGGACDCGDVNVMKTEGFCTRHGERESVPKLVPPEVTNLAKLVIPRLLRRFVYYLRGKHPEWVSGAGERFTLDDGEHLLTLLHDLTGLGAVIRSIISDAISDSDAYAQEFLVQSEDLANSPLTEEEYKAARPEVSNPKLMVHKAFCQQQYMKAMTELNAPRPQFFRVKVCGRSGESKFPPHRRCSYECMKSVINDISISDELHHTTCLEEILFWTVKYEFPEKITTWLLGLLPDDNFKEKFTMTFVDHYTRISTALMSCQGMEHRQRVSDRVVHVSVQLFSNEVYAIRMTSERQLLTRMVISLYNMLYTNLVQSTMTAVKLNTHQVLDCVSDIVKEHCFWPLISDLVNIMLHKTVALAFMEDSMLLDVWFEMISFLQGMNLNERELLQHVEYETETYYASYSAEFEISCSPLWRLLLHCTDSSTNTQLVFVLRKTMAALNTWFESIGLTSTTGINKVNEYQVSFHIPLHRYFAAFLCGAVINKGFFPKEELSEDFLKLILIHPLQIQVAFYEIFAQMWVRNGLQIRGQAMTYTQCHFCNSLVDLDLYLIQVCASYLDPDYFVQTTLKAFHVDHWNIPLEALTPRENIEPSQEEAMIEGFLSMLATLLSVRTYSGQSNSVVLHNEIVTLLCMSDRTYSQLGEAIPEKSGSTNGPTDLKEYLAKVADFKAPGFNVSGKLQQGTYCPKPEVWLDEYDPIHTMLRTVHRREFQQSMDRYTEFIQNTKAFPQGQTPWPPLRIPDRPFEAYDGLYNILRCKTTLSLCFNLLHKKLYSKTHTITDPALYFVIFLTQLIVEENEADTNMVSYVEDGDWFPHKATLDNMLHVVGTVTVQVPPSKRDKEQTPAHRMDTDETAVQDSIQNMFSQMPSQNDYDNQVEVVVPPLQRIRERGPPPGTIASPVPVTPVSSSSSSSMPAKEQEVTINESVISLLIKLHSKLSDQQGSYIPLTTRGGMIDRSNLVGDGPFFVGRVLDSLSVKSSKFAEAIEKAYKALLPRDSTDNNSAGAKKKKRAMERQKRLMEKMGRMQNKFMDKIEKTMSREEFEKLTETGETEDSYVMVELYECSICSSTTASTIERPMGMVSLMQSTCVLNFARSHPSPDNLFSPDPTKSVEILGERFRKLQENVNILFRDKHGIVAAYGLERSSDIFVQSCGHYLHLDCFQAYQESVSSQSRSRQSLTSDEYYCPLCRQLCDALIPVLPAGSQAPVVAVPPPDHTQCIKDIGAMLLQKSNKSASGILYKQMKNVMIRFKDIFNGDLQRYPENDTSYEIAPYLCSVARCNLDYILLYEQNDIVVPSRKTPIAHLLTTLSHHVKNTDGQSAECLDILSLLTSVELESSLNSSSALVQQKVVPLLLRDPITVFIQLYMNMPPHLPIRYLERLISVVYNLAYAQALFHVSCKFNDDERQSWISRGATARPGGRRPSTLVDNGRRPSNIGEGSTRRPSNIGEVTTRRLSNVGEVHSRRASTVTDASPKRTSISSERRTSISLSSNSAGKPRRMSQAESGRRSSLPSPSLLHMIIRNLSTIGFYPSDDVNTTFLECSVWSPQSIENFVQNRCLPFLEFASTLCKHVYDLPAPANPSTAQTAGASDTILQDSQQWFVMLCKHLGLIKEEVISDSPSEQALDWLDKDSHAVVKGWLTVIMTNRNKPLIRSVVMEHTRWYMPRLLELPDQYDTIFQHYRAMKCPQCSRLPIAPSICLICGAFVCFKEICCISQSGVTHAKKCGSGTSVLLDINASIVAIVRGKRATLWGSVYLDEHGEEDRDLKRGKPLYLCKERYKMLEQQWLSHNFDSVCKRWIFHADQL